MPDPGRNEHPKPKLLEQVRQHTRILHSSIRTEDAYVNWVKRFILFHGKRHPLEMAEPEVEAFLTHLAASTQNQAPAALLFLYKVVLKAAPKQRVDACRAKRPDCLPVVLTRDKVRLGLAQHHNVSAWAASTSETGAKLLPCAIPACQA